MSGTIDLQVAETAIPGGWVVGSKTRLLDVWTASSIVYWAPSFLYRAHKLAFALRDEICQPSSDRLGRRGKLKKLVRAVKSPRQMGDSVILFDTRHDTNSNLAHILQNQLGVALTGLQALGLENNVGDLTFIIHNDAPSFAVKLFETLGFRTVAASFDTFEGSFLSMQPRKFPLLSMSARVLREHAQSLGILDEKTGKKGAIFLSRRNRRGLENLGEVEQLLKNQDFRTVYAEDLSIEDQIQTVAGAEKIFGLHGAALGYQLFRNPYFHGVVMECFPSAFVTNWCRSMCLQGGDTWLGCQGDLTIQAIKNVLGDAHPHELEGDNYAVDVSAVSSVLKMANKALDEGYEADPQSLIGVIDPIVIEP